jgi:ferric-dicitrate binding protein FerR (iron transport regulator)
MQFKQLIKWAKQYRSKKTGLEDKKQFESFLDELAHLGNEPDVNDLNESKRNVWKNLETARKSEGSGRTAFLILRKSAAVLFIFTFLGLAFWNIMHQSPEVPLLVKMTSQGMRSNITLSDGSKVRINENSKLEFPEIFGEKVRVVYLNGEAFFDIKPNTTKPFKVISGTSEITVLGTSFNVNTNHHNEITVTSGRVKVTDLNSNDGVELNLGQQAILNTGQIQVKEVNPEYFIGWHTRRLVFEEEPVASVFSILERAYGVKIDVNRKQKREMDCVITGAYTGERIETILHGLRNILDFEFQTDISTKTITIDLINCK